MKAQRARVTLEQRREQGRAAQAKRRNDQWERFTAKLRVMADTEEQRWVMAYRYGLHCGHMRRYRASQRQQEAR